MKFPLPFAGLQVIVLGWLAWACPAAQNPAPPAEPAPKSAFVNDPALGRDPFFPKSIRRPLVPAVGVVSDTPAVVIPLIPDKIIVQGFSGTKDKRLVIINNRTFEASEEGDIKLDGLLYRVKVVEIRDRSVVISFKGLTKELQLRKGL